MNNDAIWKLAKNLYDCYQRNHPTELKTWEQLHIQQQWPWYYVATLAEEILVK